MQRHPFHTGGDMMFNRMRGQGATEYLVLLAVVLIIALVSIALLGFFPGLASDAKISQSASYWRGDARPFQILEHTVSSAGAISVVLQNVEATGTHTLTSINFATPSGTNQSWIGSMSFASGEIKNLTVSTSSNITGTQGAIYELTVNITYTTPNSITARQYGGKTLVGRYS